MTDWTLKTEERAILTLRQLYRQYGYMPYKMSRFEEYDLYVRNKDFLVSDQIITFSGSQGKLLALKPDVTLSIVKNAPDTPGVVQKVYYNENVYRDYREIMQAGLECVGDLSGYEIGEVVLLAVQSLQLLGERYVLELSHMGLIGAVLESTGLDEDARNQAMEFLRRKNTHQLKQLCSDCDGWEKLDQLCNCRGSAEAVLDRMTAVLTTQQEKEALEELRGLYRMLREQGCGDGVRIDFSVGSDLRYYNGVIFRGYLSGIPTAILSGGQYDRLPKKMGRKARAIGFAIYVDLLQRMWQDQDCADVDTLILHDGSVDVQTLTRTASEAAKAGSVLVCTALPQGRNWKRLVQFQEGKQL